MTEPADRATIALDVNTFVSKFWEEMEQENSLFDYLDEAAVYDVKAIRLEGREAIVNWSSQRTSTVQSVARHLITNLQFDFADWAEGEAVTVRGVMTFYGAVGKGVLPVDLPMSIYDFTFEVRRGGKYGWLMVKTIFEPVFVKQDEAAMKRYTGQETGSA
jgi:SnoaL-like domain